MEMMSYDNDLSHFMATISTKFQTFCQHRERHRDWVIHRWLLYNQVMCRMAKCLLINLQILCVNDSANDDHAELIEMFCNWILLIPFLLCLSTTVQIFTRFSHVKNTWNNMVVCLAEALIFARLLILDIWGSSYACSIVITSELLNARQFIVNYPPICLYFLKLFAFVSKRYSAITFDISMCENHRNINRKSLLQAIESRDWWCHQ